MKAINKHLMNQPATAYASAASPAASRLGTGLAALALAAGLLGAATADDAKPVLNLPTIEELTEPSPIGDIAISPDGEHIAYSPLMTERLHGLRVVKLKDLSVVGTYQFKGENDVGDIYWINNHRLVFGMAKQHDDRERPIYNNALHAIEMDGKRHEGILGDRAPNSAIWRGTDFRGWSLIKADYDEDNNILISDYEIEEWEFPHYYRLNTINGRQVNLGTAPAMYSSDEADSTGVIRLSAGSTKNGDVISYYRKDAKSDWKEVGRSSFTSGGLSAFNLTPDQQGLWAWQTAENQKPKLVRLDPQTGKTDVVYEGIKSPTHVVFDADDRTPLSVVTDPLTGKRHWFTGENPRAEGLRDLLQEDPNEHVEIKGFSKSGDRVVLHAYGNSPGRYEVIDLTTGDTLAKLTLAPQLEGKAVASSKIFNFKARDGLEMDGVVTVPVTAVKNQPGPMILDVHGGPHGIYNELGFEPERQVFAARGYTVLQVNYRGSGGHGLAFQKMGYQHWGNTMQDDLTDAVQWAIKEGYADPHRICIYGGSYGGYSALMSATREPSLYRCAAGNAGVYDLRLMRSTGDIAESQSGRHYLDEVLPKGDADLLNQSPIGAADKITAAIFLAHGTEDERAPYKQFQVMSAALDRAHKPYEVFVREKEEHGFYSLANRRAYLHALVDFFDRNTGATATAGNATP